MSYADSSLDINRITQYAKRVARETKRPLNPGFDIEWQETRYIVEDTVETKRFFGLITSMQKVPRTVSGRDVTLQIGPHWELHKRNYHLETNESDYSRYYIWLLLPDGQLKYVYKTEEYFYIQRPRREPEFGGLVLDMTVEHMLQLDHKPKSFHRDIKAGRPGREYGDYLDGPVIRHAKGVGLSLALKALLESK